MAFSSFNSFNSAESLGMSGEFNPEDLLDEMDDDDYHTHHSEKIPQQSAAQLDLDRIMARNKELESQMQADRVTSARQLGEMSAKMDFLLRQGQQVGQQPQEIQNSTQADEFASFWKAGAGSGQQTQPENNTTAPSPVNINQAVDQRLQQISNAQQMALKEENDLAERFKAEQPHLLYLGKEAFHEWKKLAALRPDLPQATRYSLMVKEVERHHANRGGGNSGRGTSMPPTHQGSDNIHPEIQNSIAQNPRSERERLHRKALDTARRVKEFRADQTRRTSLAPT